MSDEDVQQDQTPEPPPPQEPPPPGVVQTETRTGDHEGLENKIIRRLADE